MISLAREIVDFVESGIVSHAIAPLDEKLGTQALRVVSIKLLSWIKLQARFSIAKPLELRDDFPWCANMRKMLSSSAALSSIFQIRGNELSFSEYISQQDQQELKDFVNQNYNPRLMR